MNRNDFLKTLLAIPAAIGLAKVAEAETVPVPPSVKPDPKRIAETLRANEHLLPRLSPQLATTGCFYMAKGESATFEQVSANETRIRFAWQEIPEEDRWTEGCYGCCMHRGKGACDICRRRGADPEADRRMDEQTVNAMRGKPGWVEEAEGVFLCVGRTDGWVDCRVYAPSFMSPHQRELQLERHREYMAYLNELREAGFWDTETGLLSKDFEAVQQKVRARKVGRL